MKIYIPIIIIICLTGCPLNALLLSDSGSLGDDSQVIEFEEFQTPTTTTGPIEVGSSGTMVSTNVNWTSSGTGGSATISNNPYTPLGTHGLWTSDMNGYASLNNQTGAMKFTFNDDVQSAGAFINYVDDASNHVTITAYNRSGEVLETYDINQLAPVSSSFQDINAGDFRGIKRLEKDIAMLEISNSYVVLDHLGYSMGVVTPEPKSYFMGSILIIIFLLANITNKKH